MGKEVFSPVPENLGKDCRYWRTKSGCNYPKAEVEGRRSCEGVIDDVCLYLLRGRIPRSLTAAQREEIKTRKPNPRGLPPGGTK